MDLRIRSLLPKVEAHSEKSCLFQIDGERLLVAIKEFKTA
jgi:hypothetical protein